MARRRRTLHFNVHASVSDDDLQEFVEGIVLRLHQDYDVSIHVLGDDDAAAPSERPAWTRQKMLSHFDRHMRRGRLSKHDFGRVSFEDA
jgi:hypothetical protein